MADSIADKFKGLPIEDLIVSPLVGMAKGQAKLNDVTWKYINEVGFTQDKDGNTVPRSIDVQINRYVQVAGQPAPELQSMKSMVPLLPLIPIPALAITQADIEFTMEVQQSDTTTTNSSSEVDTSVTAKYSSWWGLSVSANVTGKVASSKSNTRTTDNSAKYDVKVHAEQLPPTEGMLKLSDALITMMDPVVIGNSNGGGTSGTSGT